MASLIVRNLDEAIVKALKLRASQHGVSAEAEHRRILEQVLRPEESSPALIPKKKAFSEVLGLIPNVGHDSDFERVQDDKTSHVFD
jgi:antitoxin FitA